MWALPLSVDGGAAVRLRSRGLGRKELVMDFREYHVVEEGGELVMVGTIRDPVNWDFTIRICEDDLAGLVGLGSRKAMLRFLFAAFFKRKKRNHWSQEIEQHLAEGKARRDAIADKVQEKARAAMEPVGSRKIRPVRAPRRSAANE